jgi:hypothetical protein
VRTRRPAVIALVLAAATVIGVILHQPASSSTPWLRALVTDVEDDGAVTEADGLVPDGATVLDDRYPGVANLEPALLRALRAAAADAGVPFTVNTGWRSADYQNQLLREAVAEYGSEEEAARWVATVDTSAHVSGDAVDLGSEAAAWLSEHGGPYGLCRIYDNEPWHFELRPEAVGVGCPPTYADPTQDPRMQP